MIFMTVVPSFIRRFQNNVCTLPKTYLTNQNFQQILTFSGKYIEETNSTLARGCKLGEQFYKAGSSWHPFLAGFGFDTCAVCTCDTIALEISCPRTQCPPLNCSEKIAYRQDKKACCKRCPDVSC